MRSPWQILFVLFFARTTMAFQFQSVGAVAPFMVESLALSALDIGMLIGLYLGPGVIVAFMGGGLASVLGDRRVVALSLLLMALGSLLMLVATGLSGQIAGRALAGIGGVIVNVVMTKMVVDWFAGRNLSLAMAVFLSSWPIGIALALAVLPWLAAEFGLAAAWIGTAALALVALGLFAAIYRPAEGAAARGRLTMVGLPWGPLAQAALIWALYNAALAMVFGFAPLILTEEGLSSAEAAGAASLFMFAIAAAMPLGGWLADRFEGVGGRDALILVTLVAGAIGLPLLQGLPSSSVWLALGGLGVLIGLSPGAIVGMTSQILPPDIRAFGLGVYYAIYYGTMMVAPPVAGALAERMNDLGAALDLGAAMLVVCIGLLALFRRSSKTGSG